MKSPFFSLPRSCRLVSNGGRITLSALAIIGVAWPALAAEPDGPKPAAYLMAYFGPAEKLFYAQSHDAQHWTALNGGRPVFDPGVRLRDPFLRRVNGVFHLVHTIGWDHPAIGHWTSKDLVHWRGGRIEVVPPERRRAWAPEFVYEAQTGLFHVFWASVYDGHNTMHVVTTRDWTHLKPERSRVFYDLGIHDIDLTLVRHGGRYYGFHKPGGVEDRLGNRLSVSATLDPDTNTFAAGNPGRDVLPDQTQPTEGPEVIQLIGEQRWLIYGDPFRAPLEAWETTDFTSFCKIEARTPPGAKHGSMLPITVAELRRLQAAFPARNDSAAEVQAAPGVPTTTKP